MNDCSFPGTDTTVGPDASYDTSYDPTYDTSYDPTGFSTELSMTVDFDGDGFAETTVMDTDGNGTADVYAMTDPMTRMAFVAIDSDADGLLDVYAEDLDADGEFERGWFDADGDGFAETEFDPTSGAALPFDTTDPTSDPTIDPNCDVCDTDLDTDSDLDPDLDSTDDDDVHGDPMAEIPFHQAQVGPNDCLPTSVAMLISEATGTELPQGDVVDLANELGLLGPDGMSLEGGVTLLEHWGVDAEVQTGTLDDLRTMLDQGTPIIIGLDSDDLYGVGDQPFADDFVAGHAVVITGIDDEAGLVYINDPGLPDGAGVAVSIEDFEDAWIDGGNSMIVAEIDDADAPAEVDGDGAVTVEGATDGQQSDTRADELSLIDLVLIPLRLVVR